MEHPLHFSIPILVLGCILFLAFNGLVYSAWLVYFRSARKQSVSASLVLAFLSYSLQMVGTLLVLGVGGLLHRFLFILLNLAISGGMAYFLHARGALKRESLRQVIPPFKVGWQAAVIIALALVICARQAVIAALNVPSLGDDLLYHVSALFQWITDGRIWVFPTRVIYQNTYPFNTELLFMVPALFFKNDNFILLFYSAFSFVGYVSVGYAILREFRVRRFLAVAGGLLLFLTPGVANGVFSGYTDPIVNIFLLVAMYFFLVLMRDFRERLFHYAFLASLIYLLGSKFSGPFFLGFWGGLYALLWIWRRFSGFRQVFRGRVVAALAAAFLALGCGWYISNFIHYGNPLAPQVVKVMGKEIFSTRSPEASFITLGAEAFAPLMSPRGSIDFFPLMEQENDLVKKIQRTVASYQVYPPYFYLNAPNQLGYVWGRMGVYAMPLFGIYLIWRRKWREAAFMAAVALFYVLHPYHLMLYSRYTMFVAILGVIGITGALTRMRWKWLSSAAMVAVLIWGMATVWPVGLIGSPAFLSASAMHYQTGEYFGIGPDKEAYLTCYDYVRLNISGKRIAYIGGNPYPYTYYLYGKTLTNRVYYFYTLDPKTWADDVRKNDIDLVVNLSAVADPQFQPIMDYMKAHPSDFSHMPQPGLKDSYGVCREYFVYRVTTDAAR